ncbi:hypothetical protein LJB83_01570 [Clostridia bacterium OttesenSCG-928-F22]|nr:hypothetical protein [Clostridia bacterium OttesenSCG-928-F22]
MGDLLRRIYFQEPAKMKETQFFAIDNGMRRTRENKQAGYRDEANQREGKYGNIRQSLSGGTRFARGGKRNRCDKGL